MKTFLKKFIRKFGYDVSRYAHIRVDSIDQLKGYPDLMWNAWQYGFKDIVARVKAHDFVHAWVSVGVRHGLV